MSYLRLDGHYTINRPGSFAIGAVNLTIKLDTGTTVELPVPFLPIGGDLAIAPFAVPGEGENSLCFDFDRWLPVRIGEHVARLPYAFDGQDVAVRACRAFDADPAVSWRDARAQQLAWVETWLTADVQRAD